MPDPATTITPATVNFLLAWQALEGASRRAREQFARDAGVGIIDYQALVFLSAEHGRPSKAVGEALHLTSGAMTALLDRLQDAGYLVRRPHPTDRRSTLIFLTDEGSLAASKARQLYTRAVTQTLPTQALPQATELFWALTRVLQDAHEKPNHTECPDQRHATVPDSGARRTRAGAH